MSWIEIVATFFSILCVILTILRNIWCWATGIIGVLAYMWLFYEYKLYADMGLQVVYLGQSIYGWYYWYDKQQKGQGEQAEKAATEGIRHLSLGQWGLALGAIMLLWLGVWQLLAHSTDGDIPQWDALASAISLTAQGLLAWKIIENWFFWIVADILLIFIFMYKELYLSAGTYSLFLIMAVVGWWQWNKARLLYKKKSSH